MIIVYVYNNARYRERMELSNSLGITCGRYKTVQPLIMPQTYYKLNAFTAYKYQQIKFIIFMMDRFITWHLNNFHYYTML